MGQLIIGLAVLGACLTLASAIRLWRMDPEDDRYYNGMLLGGKTTGGMERLIADQGRAALLAVVGGAIQVLALVLTFATGRT